MKKELRQYSHTTTIKGMNVTVTVCAYTKKDAAFVLRISPYYLRQYVGLGFPPKNEECIKNPLSRYAYFDSGEACYAWPDMRGKLFKIKDMEDMIAEWRKKCRNYQETMDFDAKRRKKK